MKGANRFVSCCLEKCPRYGSRAEHIDVCRCVGVWVCDICIELFDLVKDEI